MALFIGAAALVLGVGCADDEEGGGGLEADDGSAVTDGGDSAPSEESSGPGQTEATGEAPAPPEDAVAFADPGGTFRLGIDPTWVLGDPGAAPAGVTFWTVGPTSDGFDPNVNAFTQPAPVPDLEAYLNLTEAQAQDSTESRYRSRGRPELRRRAHRCGARHRRPAHGGRGRRSRPRSPRVARLLQRLRSRHRHPGNHPAADRGVESRLERSAAPRGCVADGCRRRRRGLVCPDLPLDEFRERPAVAALLDTLTDTGGTGRGRATPAATLARLVVPIVP